MLIDRNEINNTFEMTPEMLFGNYILGWKQLEDEDNPAVVGDVYSNIMVFNDKAKVLVHIQILFKPDNTWMLMVDYDPEIYRPIVLNGEVGNTKEELLTNIYVKLVETDVKEMVGLTSIIHRIARVMYEHGKDVRENKVEESATAVTTIDNVPVQATKSYRVKYDSDIPRCEDLIPDPQHYSISRILDWIGRKLRLACIHNPYISVSQSDIYMVLDSEFIGHGEYKVHVHDQKLIDALTRLGYTVEILDNMNAVDCIRISGWKTLEMKKGGKENV